MAAFTRDDLLKIAQKHAKKVRRRSAVQGWHEDESCFPEMEYGDVAAMLEEVCCRNTTVTYRDEIGTVNVEITADGVSFCDGQAYFDGVDGKSYKIDAGALERVC